jgi:hypothetical protein
MKMIINGVDVPVQRTMAVEVLVEGDSEVMPFVTLDVTGGTLHVYRSRYSHTGDIDLHMFGEPKEGTS